MTLNQIRGPNVRTAIVDGSWKTMLEIVKMKIETENRFPVRSRSLIIEVTEADDITPESRRFRLHNRPAMVQRRRSTFSRNRRSAAVMTAGIGVSPFRARSCDRVDCRRGLSSSSSEEEGAFIVLVGHTLFLCMYGI